jgi:hypothetical protein
MRIWAQVPLALSGAVGKSCARSSVGFLSALRTCAAAFGCHQPTRTAERSTGWPTTICSFELPVT